MGGYKETIKPMQLSAFTRKLFPFFLGVAALLLFTTFLHVLYPKMWALPVFSFRFELNVATWFESVLFLYVALTFFTTSTLDKLSKQARWLSRFFVVAFIFLSMDEAASIHEKGASFIAENNRLGISTVFRDTSFSWILYYTPLMLVGFFIMYRVYRGYTLSSRFLILAFLFAFGVIILEGAEAIITAQRPESQSGFNVYYASKTLGVLGFFEEGFEVLALLCLSKFNLDLLKNN